ncbi:MAG: hypothetical protein A2X61_14150 [Ignavibacteria bacterium GWB2_35_12]|nr:MAG: hypothetical protein A2X63_10495 [Ignavibacteria bacterium GWA2_35_8]OGU41248.1 MAG: hypothetical protein A2X61_14150 [Ignavibacteria bacterium GWB2_35_12]OGU96218.1 MAG: hypothetical protein A2220_12540 [Ignavibacteria bacterium RIFOXYA2_FULL_35_10]OGV23171.1 MAG: hypothetical protein A2475_17480 [Ignavibacteria bacterium RIFOXYC2_FULL_35_21]
MNYNFSWDIKKARQNIIKHNIKFENAATILRDPNALSIFDEEHSLNEDRWMTMGIDSNGILLVVIHTFHQIDDENINIRIISARKATKVEIKQYKGT